MHALVVRFDLQDAAAAAAFDALVARTLPAIHAEPGTLDYLVHTVRDEPLARVFYERYADAGAFAAHEAYPHVQDMLAEVGRLVAAAPRVEHLTPSPGA